MIAQYFAHRTRDALAGMGVKNLTSIEMEVEESFGQSATYRLTVGR